MFVSLFLFLYISSRAVVSGGCKESEMPELHWPGRGEVTETDMRAGVHLKPLWGCSGGGGATVYSTVDDTGVSAPGPGGYAVLGNNRAELDAHPVRPGSATYAQLSRNDAEFAKWVKEIGGSPILVLPTLRLVDPASTFNALPMRCGFCSLRA